MYTNFKSILISWYSYNIIRDNIYLPFWNLFWISMIKAFQYGYRITHHVEIHNDYEKNGHTGRRKRVELARSNHVSRFLFIYRQTTERDSFIATSAKFIPAWGTLVSFPPVLCTWNIPSPGNLVIRLPYNSMLTMNYLRSHNETRGWQYVVKIGESSEIFIEMIKSCIFFQRCTMMIKIVLMDVIIRLWMFMWMHIFIET